NKMSVSAQGNANWLGKKHKEETKNKMSLSQKGNTHWLGKRHSEKTKQKMSASGVGRKEKKSSSKYYGVSKARINWVARITIAGKRIHIGNFLEEIDAAKA